MFSRIITSFAGQLFIVLFGMAIVSACSMRAAPDMDYTNKLTNTHWELKKLTGYDADIERVPTLNFTKDRLSGSNGCNRIFANYAAAQDGSISIGQLGSTKMACRNQAGDLEKRINRALITSRLFAVSRDALNLMDEARNVLMVLTPKTPE